jgi:hypothetical protein
MFTHGNPEGSGGLAERLIAAGNCVNFSHGNDCGKFVRTGAYVVRERSFATGAHDAEKRATAWAGFNRGGMGSGIETASG